jgi:hypothetical protein
MRLVKVIEWFFSPFVEKKLKRLLELLVGVRSLCLARIVALVHHEPFMSQNFGSISAVIKLGTITAMKTRSPN